MRLKKLILQGFKSFADRTEFVFDSPITGIVGPNGCGKSNVVDGFKWVLGEQSAKSLRGEAMLDVIFNGSSARKPSGMAEVVLVFDNPRRADGTRVLNVDADEVSVGRRLFRDGTSEYQLNNTASRLKDVRELFLDTGVGVDAYSVIEQGRVSALLEANPAERRLIFEEAAGISKYKAKKKEAQRKLERVDQNLLRVNDIVEEVDKRLRSVKVQAGRARTFQEHSVRLRELRLTYVLQEYHLLFTQQAEHTAAHGEASARVESIGTELSEKQLGLSESRQALELASQQRQRAQYDAVQAQAAVESARQRQQYAARQLEQIAEQVAQYAADREALEGKAAEVSTALGAEEARLAALGDEVSTHRREIEARQQAFHDGQLTLNSISRELEQNKAAVLDLMRRGAQVNNRLGAIEIERKNIASQQGRIGDRRRVVMGELETLEAGRGELDAQFQAVTGEISGLLTSIDASAAQAATLGRQIADYSAQLGAAREHRSGLMSRQKLLQDMEAKREGFTEGVKSVLRQREARFPFVRGLVADILRVDVEHAHVIEAALDGRDQWLLADDPAALLGAQVALGDLEGRVNILCAARMAHANAVPDGYDWNVHPQRIRLAIDLVRFEAADEAVARHLLGRSVVVDTLAEALDLHAAAPRGFRYITRDGQVVEADGTVRAGPLTAAMGLISRRSELEALKHQIAEVERRIEELSAQVSAGNEQARELQQNEKALRNQQYAANTRRVEISSRIAQNTDKQSAFRREMPVLERELQNYLDQGGRLKGEEADLSSKRQSLEAEQADRSSGIELLATRQIEANDAVRQAGEALTGLRVLLGQAQEKHIASQQQVQRLRSSQGELSQQIERISRTSAQVQERRGGVEAEGEEARQAEAQAAGKQEILARQSERFAAQVDEISQQVERLDGEVAQVLEEHADSSQQVHALEVKIGEMRVRLEGLVQRTLEELELDVPAQYATLNEQGGYTPADVDWEQVAEEIRLLKEKIQRLGNVNLDAIGELEELETRSTFLSSQVADLTTSKAQLEELIEQINVESSARFEATFNAVREHFQGMFRKLFGGGKADIYLETEIEDRSKREPVIGPDGQPILQGPVMKRVDVLDAGIEIIARPPGKQPVSISQLSGGEKTMTCVALLMSIFKSKPSPFCILDEVDAALDEANNQRFNLIVQEFLEQSQFIIITHSKRTMQIADVLYGVTMQEQGVSKRVAVKFDQVDNEGHVKEHAAA